VNHNGGKPLHIGVVDRILFRTVFGMLNRIIINVLVVRWSMLHHVFEFWVALKTLGMLYSLQLVVPRRQSFCSGFHDPFYACRVLNRLESPFYSCHVSWSYQGRDGEFRSFQDPWFRSVRSTTHRVSCR